MTRKAHAPYNASQLAEQKLAVLKLRVEGKTVRDIGAILGLDTTTVLRREKAALAGIVMPDIEEIRKLEMERLDDVYDLMYARASAGDEKAANVLVRIMDRRAKMLGLDAATKVEVTTSVTTPFDEHLAELSRELGLNDPTLAPAMEPSADASWVTTDRS